MASPVITLFSGAMQAMGTIAEGNANLASAKAEQKNLSRMATGELAAATHAMAAQSRATQLLQSRGQAVAAASGGGALDETVLELTGNIARDASVERGGMLAVGQTRANDLLYKGKIGVTQAEFNKRMGYVTAGGQILSAAADAASMTSTAYGKYGMGGPNGGATAADAKPWWG